MQSAQPSPSAEDIRTAITPFLALEGPMLPMLHAIQEAFGHVPETAVPVLAETLNLGRAEVHGVISFYHDFREAPDMRPEVQLCGAEACQARGVETLVSAAEAAAGDRVRLSKVYCLGLCSVGPAARVGDTVHARLNQTALVALVENA